MYSLHIRKCITKIYIIKEGDEEPFVLYIAEDLDLKPVESLEYNNKRYYLRSETSTINIDTYIKKLVYG